MPIHCIINIKTTKSDSFINNLMNEFTTDEGFKLLKIEMSDSIENLHHVMIKIPRIRNVDGEKASLAAEIIRLTCKNLVSNKTFDECYIEDMLY